MLQYEHQVLHVNGFALQIHISRFTLIVRVDIVHQELKFPGPRTMKQYGFPQFFHCWKILFQWKLKVLDTCSKFLEMLSMHNTQIKCIMHSQKCYIHRILQIYRTLLTDIVYKDTSDVLHTYIYFCLGTPYK